MPGTSYLPTTDAGLLNWSQNFSDLINADPTRYGLTIEQAGGVTDD